MDEAEREQEEQKPYGELHPGHPDRGSADVQQLLDPGGGATGPDVGVVRGLLAVGMVPHAYEVTQVSPCGYLVAESDCSGWGSLAARSGQRAGVAVRRSRPSA